MEAAGLFTEAGRAAVQVAQDNGWWTRYDAVEDLIEPPLLAESLDSNPDARQAWNNFSLSSRKAMLWWVISAIKDTTKEVRISQIVEKAQKGERALG